MTDESVSHSATTWWLYCYLDFYVRFLCLPFCVSLQGEPRGDSGVNILLNLHGVTQKSVSHWTSMVWLMSQFLIQPPWGDSIVICVGFLCLPFCVSLQGEQTPAQTRAQRFLITSSSLETKPGSLLSLPHYCLLFDIQTRLSNELLPHGNWKKDAMYKGIQDEHVIVWSFEIWHTQFTNVLFS